VERTSARSTSSSVFVALFVIIFLSCKDSVDCASIEKEKQKPAAAAAYELVKKTTALIVAVTTATQLRGFRKVKLSISSASEGHTTLAITSPSATDHELSVSHIRHHVHCKMSKMLSRLINYPRWCQSQYYIDYVPKEQSLPVSKISVMSERLVLNERCVTGLAAHLERVAHIDC
jgi:hypothetical protein